jgi:hypothetical protein
LGKARVPSFINRLPAGSSSVHPPGSSAPFIRPVHPPGSSAGFIRRVHPPGSIRRVHPPRSSAGFNSPGSSAPFIRRVHPPVETGGWKTEKSAFADCTPAFVRQRSHPATAGDARRWRPSIVILGKIRPTAAGEGTVAQ